MKFFIHVVTDGEPLIDEQGSDYSSLASAEADAIQAARDLMAEVLKSGNYAPVDWTVQVCSGDGSVVAEHYFRDCAIDAARDSKSKRHV